MPESKKQKSNDLSFLNDYDQRVHGSVGFDDGIDQTSGHPISNPPSDTVLDLGAWERRQGREMVAQSNRIQQRYDVSSPDTPEEWLERRHVEDIMADFYSAAFEYKPEVAERQTESCKERAEFMETLFETEEYKSLKRKTTLNPLLSEIAATCFSDQFADILERSRNNPDNPGGDGPGPGPGDNPGGDGPGNPGKPGNGPGKPGDDPGDNPGGDGDQRKKLREATDIAKEANDEVEDMKGVQRAIGHGGGDDNGRVSIDEVKKMYRMVRGSSRLKKICERVGRFKRLASGLQRLKTNEDKSEVVGVETSGNMELALPHELAFLLSDDPLLADDGMRRYLEGQLLSLKLGGNPKAGLGPLVLVVDESGSMGGHNEDAHDGQGPHIWNAKAIAAAYYDIAKQQKRWLCLVSFSGHSSGKFLVIKPEDPKPVEFMQWLEHFFGGGTDEDVPFITLPSRWHELGCASQDGKVDICLITDAYIRISDHVQESFNNWKQENDVHMTSLVLSERGQPMMSSLDAVSDKIHHITNLGIENKAIEEVLSV